MNNSSPSGPRHSTRPPGGRSGSSALILVLTTLLLALLVVASLLPRAEGARLIDITLVVFAFVGIIALFFYAVGILQLAVRAAPHDLTRRLADQFGEGLAVVRPDGSVAYANAAYRAWGQPDPGGEVFNVERLLSGQSEVAGPVYRLAQAAQQGKRASEELRLTPSLSGPETGWYRVRVRPLDSPQDQGLTLWSLADVTTERVRHERVFLELQNAIDFLDHAPAGFFSARADGSIDYLNKTLANWLDYDLAQVGTGGLRLSDIIAGDGAILLAQTHAAAGQSSTETFDIDLKKRTGENLPVRLIHKVHVNARREREPSRTLVLNRTAADAKAEDLQAAQVRFARFFNATPMAIATLSETGAVVRANAAFARLFEPQNAEGAAAATVIDLIDARERPALGRALARASANQSDIAPIDVTMTPVSGPIRAARLFLSPVTDADGAQALLYALDTTEQQTLRESFAQSQKMQAIGQLAGGVAHDFNNVLTAIIGYSDMLLTQHRSTDPSFHDIMQIRQNANRAAGLVRQLLAFSRRQTLRPQMLQLGDMISELRILLQKLAGERVELDYKQARDLWLTRADQTQIEQVIINLVVNARDAMNNVGKITIRTLNITAQECGALNEKALPAADYVAVEVEDTGTGIPPEIREKIFEPFFTTKETGKGTGLGLAMVYGIVKQSGGFVFCESEPGKGALFRLLLPRLEAPEAAVAPKKEAAKSRPAVDMSGKGTILLVEDEHSVRKVASRALRNRGYTVLEAETGQHALDVVAETKEAIGLIISDVVMPEMDGPTMLGELRRRGITARIIFVSGYAEDAFSRNLPDGEDFGFLAKPFTIKDLLEVAKTSLE
ncbi:MAG: response regulator [Hyphomicrobiales bacterium]|nr:response regulator [Hyphomicrobiales bacterium]